MAKAAEEQAAAASPATTEASRAGALPAAEVAAPASGRRYVPGSEMAKQALSGNRAPAGTYVTTSGRVVMPAPPPK